MPIDQHLSDQLHDLVDREPGSPAPTRLLLERGRRRARRRRTAALAGVTAAAVLGVTAGAVALQQSPANGPAATAQKSAQGNAQESTQQGTPQIRLAAAVAASGSTSYAFTITMVAGPETRTARGEFDPAATTGVLHYGDGSEQRLVAGQRFIGDGKGHWKFQNDGRHDSLTFSGLGDDPFPVSGDPAQLLQNLAKVGTVTEASPGVYRFTIPAGPTEGEATVADGKVKKVTYNTPFYGLVDQELVATVTVEFADYGRTVKVEKPERWVD
ncbi:hypothetical protein [Dactylosporangium sp. NPDC006015]|uniref:hypothetical protein n=1 Tax=Dactylosporangium sp. NPDC006015 TaxID=3154576 RepID=UPI0033B66A83